MGELDGEQGQGRYGERSQGRGGEWNMVGDKGATWDMRPDAAMGPDVRAIGMPI